MAHINHVGSTRCTFVVGSLALKFARSAHGARCNLSEADMYRRVNDTRRAMLCPVLACSPNGAVLVMEAATPLTWDEAAQLRGRRGFPDWDYSPFDRIECPFEYKCSDWGWLRSGRLVALDYPDTATQAEG